MTWREKLDDFAVEYITCEFCGATPGNWCRTVRSNHPGRLAQWLHADRTWAVQQMWTWGYEEGVQDERYTQERRRERENRTQEERSA